MTVFEAYITNLGKYAEGQLVGETLKFPATTEEVQSLLKNIGVDGVRYEEFFITAFDGDVMGLYDYLAATRGAPVLFGQIRHNETPEIQVPIRRRPEERL